MKHLILTIVLLLLISCSSMQERANELRHVAMACNEREQVPVMENGVAKIEDGKPVMRRPEGTCADEWAAWNEAEERRVNAELRRAAEKRPKCPEGKVAYCDHWCSKDRSAKRKWACVDRWIFREMMRF